MFSTLHWEKRIVPKSPRHCRDFMRCRTKFYSNKTNYELNHVSVHSHLEQKRSPARAPPNVVPASKPPWTPAIASKLADHKRRLSFKPPGPLWRAEQRLTSPEQQFGFGNSTLKSYRRITITWNDRYGRRICPTRKRNVVTVKLNNNRWPNKNPSVENTTAIEV